VPSSVLVHPEGAALHDDLSISSGLLELPRARRRTVRTARAQVVLRNRIDGHIDQHKRTSTCHEDGANTMRMEQHTS
jgi:hypothetical protein